MFGFTTAVRGGIANMATAPTKRKSENESNITKNETFTKQDLQTHFSRLDVSSLFLNREMTHFLQALPSMFIRMLEEDSDKIVVRDNEIKSFRNGREVFKFPTPFSHKEMFTDFVERDYFLRKSLEKMESEQDIVYKWSF